MDNIPEEGLSAIKNIIQEGFISFIDELHIPKEAMFSMVPGISAEKFMLFASEGECTKDDDTRAFRVLSVVIADHLERNSEAIEKQPMSISYTLMSLLDFLRSASFS